MIGGYLVQVTIAREAEAPARLQQAVKRVRRLSRAAPRAIVEALGPVTQNRGEEMPAEAWRRRTGFLSRATGQSGFWGHPPRRVTVAGVEKSSFRLRSAEAFIDLFRYEAVRINLAGHEGDNQLRSAFLIFEVIDHG